MAILSITKAADRVGISRSTIHLHIAKGKLSKSYNGGIDESELLRVYGNFKTPDATPLDSVRQTQSDGNQTHQDSVNQTHMDSNQTHSAREVELLMQMMEMLKTQLNEANKKIDRLEKRDDQWMAIFQNRLPAPMSETLAGVKNKVKSFLTK